MRRIILIVVCLALLTIPAWAVRLEPKEDADVKAEKQKYEQDLTELKDIQTGKLDTTSKLAAAVRKLAEIQERKTKTQRKLIGD